MGILGLLPLLKDIQSKTSITNFRGQTVGIDAYCWLHKGTYGCAKDVVLGKPTRVYINYVIKRVNMLLSHDITPILVFDGGYLPAKAEKEKERRMKRKESKARAIAALREGKLSDANDHFQKCCDITPEMAANVIEACYKLNVKCIVAPYEADAQLAFLMKEGITHLTISEDSDLLLYGCNRVLYKMSADGDGMLVDTCNLSKVRTIQLSSFTLEMFRHMCMLSGCDYLPSIKGMGLKKAHQALQRHSSVKQCIRAFKCSAQYNVPAKYEENFRRAELVFKFQLVFDPVKKCVAPLNTPEESLQHDDTEYCGPQISNELALQIALGNIDPIHKKKLANHKDFAGGALSKVTHTSGVHASKQKIKDVSSQYSNDDELSDCTPPSDPNFFKDKKNTCTRNLNARILVSRQSQASKSLKRLRDSDTSPEKDDKWQKLYGISQQPSSWHHSAFSKKSSAHKFKNPFRTDEKTRDSPEQQVVSRYFCAKQSLSELPVIMQSSEPLVFEKKLMQPSLIEYLDHNDVRTVPAPKPLTLSSPRPPPKQAKLNLIVMSTSEEHASVRKVLSPLDNITDIDCESPSSKTEISPESNCSNSDLPTSARKIDLDSSVANDKLIKIPRRLCNSLKIGLSRNSLSSSQQPKITNLLRAFNKNGKCNAAVLNRISKEEDELLPQLPNIEIEELPSTSPKVATSVPRNKPIGLSRRKKSTINQGFLSISAKKQTQIAFSNYTFKREEISDDVICIS